MAKSLILLRHAKSSWDDPQLDDHDRPLNGRGRKAASRVGRFLHDESFKIDLVLCSTSARTRETAKRVFGELSCLPAISFREDLYHASSKQISDILRQIEEPTNTALLIGHNPGFEEFLGGITGEQIRFPTAALAVLEFEIDFWNQFDLSSHGELIRLWKPRDAED